MKRDITNVFPQWLAAMREGDFLFSGGEIQQTRQHRGRGANRVEEAVEAAGNALLLRDAANAHRGHHLVGGYSDEAECFYAFDHAAGSLFHKTWLKNKFTESDGVPDLPPGWRDRILDDDVVRLYGFQHEHHQEDTKLEVLKSSNNGDLPLLELQRGAIARLLFELLETSDQRNLAHPVAAAFRDGGIEGFAERVFANGKVKPADEASHDDRVLIVRVLHAFKPEDLPRFHNLRLGIPEGDDLLWEATRVTEESVIY